MVSCIAMKYKQFKLTVICLGYLEILGLWRTSSLSLLPGPLYPKVEISVRIIVIGQIDLCTNYFY